MLGRDVLEIEQGRQIYEQFRNEIVVDVVLAENNLLLVVVLSNNSREFVEDHKSFLAFQAIY